MISPWGRRPGLVLLNPPGGEPQKAATFCAWSQPASTVTWA